MSQGNQHNRIYGLDILRAFAILFVLYSHAFFLIMDHVNERVYNLLSLDGVTLFFVLSGFLIGGILIRTIENKGFDFKELLNFWTRRWFRTLPNYFLMLLVLILIAMVTGKETGSLARYFFFLQNFSAPHPAFFPEAWSLTVEEWFYLLIPAGLFLSLRMNSKLKSTTIIIWIISIILLVTMYRGYRAITLDIPDFERWDQLQRKVVLTRLDSIMYGFLGAWMAFYRHASWLKFRKLLFTAGILLLLIPVMVEFFMGKSLLFLNYFSLPLTSLATLFMLPMLSGIRTGKGKIYGFLTFVSMISYSMYLVNFSLVQLTIIPSLTPVIIKITTNHLWISLIRVTCYWGLTFLLSYLMYRFYENPMMNLRDKIKWSPRPVK
jgi:peptidoglycan/LPS O-acetylase OafA/YrhL